MGCASSKLFRKDLKQEILFGDCANHVVSLTSSTYGVLNLDKAQQKMPSLIKECTTETKISPPRERPEVINAWELMGDLEEEIPNSCQGKKSPKFLRGFVGRDARSPFKFLNQMGSPNRFKKLGGKENRGRINGRSDYSPKGILKPCNLLENQRKSSPNLRIPKKLSPATVKCDGLRIDSDATLRRRSLTPLFDPGLVESMEKELSEEEQIKKMVSVAPTPRKSRIPIEMQSNLESFQRNCPPGGENAVVIYTTTLRGIRKTFEECNIARSIVESYQIQTFERDVSMHSGFKEELRRLMGSKEVKVPLVFVKGRLIGGADEMVRLEEEGKLGNLFYGIPKATAGGCEGCAGIRFVMCMECNGSCKLWAEDGKKTMKCVECNENGLIQCPICC